ncbi:MAG: Crp/Fnr family transcriptional regulator [Oligoflexia bacterium]|nr:Crp/Fnr family transcriptional regulator [Oligoflexia bacterium]
MSFFSKNKDNKDNKDSIAERPRTLETSKRFSEGEIIFAQGDQINDLYIINKGEIQLYCKGNRGRITPVGVLKRQEFLGIPDLFTSGKSSFTAKTLTDVELVPVAGDDIKKIVAQLPEWVQKLILTLSERLDSAKDILSEHEIFDKRLYFNENFNSEDEVKIKKSIEQYSKEK